MEQLYSKYQRVRINKKSQNVRKEFLGGLMEGTRPTYSSDTSLQFWFATTR